VIWSADALDLEVTDQGPARPRGAAASAGHGLLGLEERVHLLGGSIASGRHGTGFRVAATLPTGRAA
jgi:signal transduction histidine kinase